MTGMEPLSDCFKLGGGDVVTLLGSGGKTSLFWRLASAFPHWRLLLTTSVRMVWEWWRPFDAFVEGAEAWEAFAPKEAGAYLLAARTGGGRKLHGPSMEQLSHLLPRYDLTILEGDGAKERPLKGWADHEPVVPAETTMSIGVLPVTVLGMAATEENVHRLPAFCRLTGLRIGEAVDERALLRVISNENGLWKRARGRKILFLNQAEGEKNLAKGRALAALLRREDIALDGIVLGSVRENRGKRL